MEEPDNYDSIYQSDLCGWCAQLGYERPDIYAANVFTAGSNEYLEAVGFYATDINTSYEIYAVQEFKGVQSLQGGVMVASGTKREAGYYTIPLSRKIALTQGKKFAVVIKITTPSAKKPLAVEYVDPNGDVTIDLTDGESYISATGVTWEHAEETQGCNICLKAYTKKR